MKDSNKGEIRLNKKVVKIVLWSIIAILALFVIYAIFFKGTASSSAISSAGQVAKTASSGMVGGC